MRLITSRRQQPDDRSHADRRLKERSGAALRPRPAVRLAFRQTSYLVQLVDQLERLQLERVGSTASVAGFSELQLDRLQEERLQLERSSAPASLQEERLQLERL